MPEEQSPLSAIDNEGGGGEMPFHEETEDAEETDDSEERCVELVKEKVYSLDVVIEFLKCFLRDTFQISSEKALIVQFIKRSNCNVDEMFFFALRSTTIAFHNIHGNTVSRSSHLAYDAKAFF